MARVLIVGYGNLWRSDDAVGGLAADELAQRKISPEVGVIRLHQLMPEVAETVSHSSAVIFIDAVEGSTPGEVHCQRLEPSTETARFSHQLSPGVVLALARRLYGAAPRAFCVTLTAQTFDHGEGLSAPVAAALPDLIATVEKLARKLLAAEPVSCAADGS